MTRFLLQEPPEGAEPETTPLTWACLECSETVTDLDIHAHGHESEVVEVFTSRHALERVLAEEQRRASLKIPTGDPHE